MMRKEKSISGTPKLRKYSTRVRERKLILVFRVFLTFWYFFFVFVFFVCYRQPGWNLDFTVRLGVEGWTLYHWEAYSWVDKVRREILMKQGLTKRWWSGFLFETTSYSVSQTAAERKKKKKSSLTGEKSRKNITPFVHLFHSLNSATYLSNMHVVELNFRFKQHLAYLRVAYRQAQRMITPMTHPWSVN